MREEIRTIQRLMEDAQYVTDAPVATSVHLAKVFGRRALKLARDRAS